MKVTPLANFVVSLLLAFASAPVCADMPGGRDHPRIPRIDGTTIHGYLHSDYDEGEFIKGFAAKKLDTDKVGGKRTRIFYLAPTALTPAQIFRNYRVALDDLGEVELVYECEAKCASNLGPDFIWSSRNRIPTDLSDSRFVYAPLGYGQQRYAYWRVKAKDSRYHVAVFSAHLSGIQARSVRNTRSIHVDIVEESDFKATLKVVTPDEISKGISDKGSIALYGIHFDVDSDKLKDESVAALEAIATALKNDEVLKVYVVGHTDNQGAYDHNLDLARRRAQSVVNYLTEKHGVASGRLRAVGVGPVAPVASNRTKDGQALNRRVELVEF